MNNITRFWQDVRDHPAYEGHDMHRHPRFNHRTHGIPLRLHGDGVTSISCGKTWSQSIDVLSWSSCVAPIMASWVTNPIIFFVYESMLVDDESGDSMDEVFRVLVWSLYWLYQGVYPDRNHDNIKYVDIDPKGVDALRALHALADGFFMPLWVIRMDLEYIVKRLRVASYRRQDCILCPAGNHSRLPWTDCRDNASWISRLWDRESWKEAFPRPHRLFRHLPGVTIAMYIPDILRCKFLGVGAYVLGSVLQCLYVFLIGGNGDAALAYVFERVRRVYRRLGISKDRFS